MEITLAEYRRLKIAEIKLDMLEAGGVNNWSFYSESLNPDGELSYREERERIESEFPDEN